MTGGRGSCDGRKGNKQAVGRQWGLNGGSGVWGGGFYSWGKFLFSIYFSHWLECSGIVWKPLKGKEQEQLTSPHSYQDPLSFYLCYREAAAPRAAPVPSPILFCPPKLVALTCVYAGEVVWPSLWPEDPQACSCPHLYGWPQRQCSPPRPWTWLW